MNVENTHELKKTFMQLDLVLSHSRKSKLFMCWKQLDLNIFRPCSESHRRCLTYTEREQGIIHRRSPRPLLFSHPYSSIFFPLSTVKKAETAFSNTLKCADVSGKWKRCLNNAKLDDQHT